MYAGFQHLCVATRTCPRDTQQPQRDKCLTRPHPNNETSFSWIQVDRSRAQSPHVKAEGEEADKELAPVLDNSIAWGGFVASSTNLRYQLVNGFEERALVSNYLLLTIVLF